MGWESFCVVGFDLCVKKCVCAVCEVGFLCRSDIIMDFIIFKHKR